MSRPIKFRAKSIDTSKWVYGTYAKHIGNFVIFDEKTGERYIIDPTTLGLYTGLKDKNGTEIYEGDILITNHELKRAREKCAKPRLKVVGWVSTHYKVGLNIGNTNDNESKVIGNIYQNPELLEAKS